MKRTRRSAKRREYEAELEQPDFPLALLYLWIAYNRIRRRKGGNGFGVMPLEWPDIDSFNRLTGTALAPWEVGMIERLDDAYLKAMADAAKKDGE